MNAEVHDDGRVTYGRPLLKPSKAELAQSLRLALEKCQQLEQERDEARNEWHRANERASKLRARLNGHCPPVTRHERIASALAAHQYRPATHDGIIEALDPLIDQLCAEAVTKALESTAEAAEGWVFGSPGTGRFVADWLRGQAAGLRKQPRLVVAPVGLMTPTLRIRREADSWYAEGALPDGSRYFAVADKRASLETQIQESARAEGWAGWVVTTCDATVQIRVRR